MTTLNSRIEALERQAGPIGPIAIHRVDVGYDEATGQYFSETKEQALARSGIQPNPQDPVIYVIYTREKLP